ncbi:hypothetical protein HK100_002094, partial [Physocladia obscura]
MTHAANTTSITIKTTTLIKLPAHAGAFEFQHWLEAFLIHCNKNYGHASRIWIPPTLRTPQTMPFNPANPLKPPGTVQEFYRRHEAQMDEAVVQILNLKHQIHTKETEIREVANTNANFAFQEVSDIANLATNGSGTSVTAATASSQAQTNPESSENEIASLDTAGSTASSPVSKAAPLPNSGYQAQNLATTAMEDIVTH